MATKLQTCSSVLTQRLNLQTPGACSISSTSLHSWRSKGNSGSRISAVPRGVEKVWANEMVKKDPDYFLRYAESQSPEFLYIGCSDSRVVPNDILGMEAGDVFVHRNVGNVVSQSDCCCMSAVEFSVGALKVDQILLCGHYGCGACKAAATLPLDVKGYVNGFISHIRDVMDRWSVHLKQTPENIRPKLLVELNAVEQTRNLCVSQVVQAAWNAEQPLAVNIIIYDIATGLLMPLVKGIDSTTKHITPQMIGEDTIVKSVGLADEVAKRLTLGCH